MKQSSIIHIVEVEDFLNSIKQIVTDVVNSSIPTEKTESNSEVLTLDETAKYFKKSRDTIENWVKKGYLKSYGVGGSIFFRKSDLDSALIPLRKK